MPLNEGRTCGWAAWRFGESPKVGSWVIKRPHIRSEAPDDVRSSGDDRALLADLMKLAVITSLRQAGEALDRLWLDAATAGRDEVVQMADAAQAVHRALIALS
jgi:hypothetical protein